MRFLSPRLTAEDGRVFQAVKEGLISARAAYFGPYSLPALIATLTTSMQNQGIT
jgi:hypothetical protein